MNGEKRYCAYCAAELLDGDDYCATCGEPVATSPRPRAVKPRPVDPRPVTIGRSDARMMAQEQQRAEAGGIAGAITWILSAIVIGALIQTIFPGTSAGVSFGIGAVLAIVPCLIITSLVQDSVDKRS